MRPQPNGRGLLQRGTRLRSNETGVALVISLMAMTLLTGLGVALVLTTMTETAITSNYRSAQETFYAADAGIERSIQDIVRASDWNYILGGTSVSGFIDAPPRKLPDGADADLTLLTTALQSESNTFYGSDPNRPLWRVYASGPMSNLMPPGTITTRAYILVWVADDPAETDGDPTKDTNRVLLLRAEAFGEGGSRKVIEAAITGVTNLEAEKGYVGQRGQDEQNRRARKAPVQTPGQALTEMRMDIATGGMVVQ
ncbi:MAG: pilus assembly PilX N-terminal domain-containing protein [Acidobacteria bacterium]|nr:pilus assembly PilX N-terminal domain-containing protein [Acidobacteriota bacterium]